MKISKLLQTLSTAVIDSKDDIEITNEQADKLVNEIITTDEAFLKLLKDNTSKKYKLPQDSDFLEKDIKYICKSLILEPNTKTTVEICSLFTAFRPSTLKIKVINMVDHSETFCEILNVSVMGDPQVCSFSGISDLSMRGNSLVFENERDVSEWAIFGSSFGQGLTIDIFNPHSAEIKIEMLLTGWETNTNYIGMCLPDYYANKFIFSRVECVKNKITTAHVLAGRSGAFKPKYLQIISNNGKDLEIVDITVLRKQQIDYLDESNSLSSNHFRNMKKVNFDVFGASNRQGLEIKFKNNNYYNVTNYITVVGIPASSIV